MSGLSKSELLARAAELGIPGRSKMTRDELETRRGRRRQAGQAPQGVVTTATTARVRSPAGPPLVRGPPMTIDPAVPRASAPRPTSTRRTGPPPRR